MITRKKQHSRTFALPSKRGTARRMFSSKPSPGLSSLRLALEVESDFAGHRSRRDIVGSTKGRKEVV